MGQHVHNMGWESDDSDDWEANADAQIAARQTSTTAKKTDWEDDDDESEEEAPKVQSQPRNENKKQVSKAKSKKDVLRGGNKNATAAEPVDPLAEKARIQKMVEDEEMALSAELFGEAEDLSGGSASNPKTKAEFEALGTIIANKLREHEASVHFGACLKTVLRVALENSPSAVCKELASLCNTQCAEKQKKERRRKQRQACRRIMGTFLIVGLGTMTMAMQ